MARLMLLFAIFAYCWCTVHCDIYLHNPRGSNNRQSESGRARTNANRLFDSQNNNRGGYNTGNLYYHSGSVLPIEWTNQHSCGDQNSHCDIVLQYMCSGQVRDGVSTQTVPAAHSKCAYGDCDSDPKYGQHESHAHYLSCQRRSRNNRLFTAGQRLRGSSAIYTRQNPNGQRYGYECPEERDYYPYWGHSPWRDIAILTNDITRCNWYRATSQNVQPRYQCSLPLHVLQNNPSIVLPNNQRDCANLTFANYSAVWQQQQQWQLQPPVCRLAQRTRDNHLGNSYQAKPYIFNWTVPAEAENKRCVLRIRYNISTADYDRWATVDGANPVPPSGLADRDSAAARGFVLRNNPQVTIFNDAPEFKLQLQVNVQQFGRVFQDRSHAFEVRPRPDGVGERDTIFNVNVRGKRGNIVQVYPAVEYDFTPSTLHASQSDLVHIQWTGSNTNNAGNDGQGLAGSDRSNLVQLLGNDLAGNYAQLLSNSSSWTAPRDLVTLGTLSPQPQLGGDLEFLNDAGTYFDLQARRLTSTGQWAFISSRNNNFSNRSHKWRLIVSNGLRATLPVDGQADQFSLFDGSLVVKIPSGTFSAASFLELEVSNSSWTNKNPSSGDTWFTDFIQLSVIGEASSSVSRFSQHLEITMTTSQDAASAHDLQVYSTEPTTPIAMATAGIAVSPLVAASTATVTFSVSRPGVYGVRGYRYPPVSIAAVIAVVLAVALLAAVVAAVVVVHRRQPTFFSERFRFLKRSMQSDV